MDIGHERQGKGEDMNPQTYANPANEQTLILLLILLAIWLAVKYRRPFRPSGYAHGTARWASERDLERAKMFSRHGLIFGRTPRRRKSIRLNKYTHVSVAAPTGAGKGVSFVIPTLLSYRRGSVFVFDPKGELFLATARARRRMGQRVYVLDPFHVCTRPGASDRFNPLDCIPPGPTVVDEARAMANAMVVRPPDGDKEPFWNDSAVMLLTAMLTAALSFMKGELRTFGTVREMMTDPEIYAGTIAKLQEMGGIPARLANQLVKLSESAKTLADVTSTANSHASFADSEPVSRVLETSTFSADVLLKPGSTIYFVLPVEQLDAQRGYLRLVVSTLLRHILRFGVKRGGETLFLLDECSSLSGLDALAQGFVLGRGKGIRLYTFWQSAEQAQAAFKKTPNLVADNSDAQIYFGVNGYPTAELVSKMLGNWTMLLETANESDSGGRSSASGELHGPTYQSSWSSSRNYSEHARALLTPSEILQLSGEYFIAFIRGVRPLMGRRIKYYSDPIFYGTWKRMKSLAFLLFLLGLLGFMVWGLIRDSIPN
jgi:type IV secretion system protein VirD4